MRALLAPLVLAAVLFTSTAHAADAKARLPKCTAPDVVVLYSQHDRTYFQRGTDAYQNALALQAAGKRIHGKFVCRSAVAASVMPFDAMGALGQPAGSYGPAH